MKTQTITTACRAVLTSRLTLCAVAILGGLFLRKFAVELQRQPPIRFKGQPIIVKSELLAIHAPQKLIQFAKEHGNFQNNEELALAIEKAHLNGYWYVTDVGYTMDDGEFDVSSYVGLPGDQPYLFDNVVTVLATLAGNPPTNLEIDFRSAYIDVLDESLMGGNPMETVEDLQELQLASHSRAAFSPYHLGTHLAHARVH